MIYVVFLLLFYLKASSRIITRICIACFVDILSCLPSWPATGSSPGSLCIIFTFVWWNFEWRIRILKNYQIWSYYKLYLQFKLENKENMLLFFYYRQKDQPVFKPGIFACSNAMLFTLVDAYVERAACIINTRPQWTLGVLLRPAYKRSPPNAPLNALHGARPGP